MIQLIKKKHIEQIEKLGNDYDDKFSTKFDISTYIDNKVYKGYCYILENKVVGFALITNVYENIEIEMIYVDKMFRNQKIATKMLNFIFEQYPNKKFLLEVSKKNIIAYNLYKNLGFEKINIRKRYYNGVDAIVMRR